MLAVNAAEACLWDHYQILTLQNIMSSIDIQCNICGGRNYTNHEKKVEIEQAQLAMRGILIQTILTPTD